MNGITLIPVVCLCENYTVTVDQIRRVLLVDVPHVICELKMPFNGVRIMLYGIVEGALFNIYRFYAVVLLSFLKLIVEDFFKTHAIKIQ